MFFDKQGSRCAGPVKLNQMSQLNLTFFRKLKGVVTVEPFTKEVFVIVWGLVKTGVYDPYISGIFEISLEHVSFLKYPLNGYS